MLRARGGLWVRPGELVAVTTGRNEAAEAEARHEVDVTLDLFRLRLDADEREAEMSTALDAYAAAVRATEAARYRGEAMVERVAEAIAQRAESYAGDGIYYIELARAALAVITEEEGADG